MFYTLVYKSLQNVGSFLMKFLKERGVQNG
nr:MAG TPA_asm: hypothetical protein [Caudoviricetes sp.]